MLFLDAGLVLIHEWTQHSILWLLSCVAVVNDLVQKREALGEELARSLRSCQALGLGEIKASLL